MEGDLTEQENSSMALLHDKISKVMEFQRLRSFSIRSQQRSDRSTESYIASRLGYSNDLDDKKRKELFSKASSIRKEIEANIEAKSKAGSAIAFPDCDYSLDILKVAYGAFIGRKPWDDMRAKAEKDMISLAKTLPGYDHVHNVKGFTAKGFAIIVGESGDLANYPTITRLWKRLGISCIDGERQRKHIDKEKAIAHGYSPRRRAEIWALADSMFRHQWSGEAVDVGTGEVILAHPKGPYGEVYKARRDLTSQIHPDWTPAHSFADARRIMMKKLIFHIWKAWRHDVGLQEDEDTRIS
jgi:hypothetical protein